MAKKKKRKEDPKQNSGYRVELIGVLFILLTILGFGRFGLVGAMISNFAAFLVGVWYNVLLVVFLVIGGYLIVKREIPDFLTKNLVGIYVFTIGILVLSHISYVEQNDLAGFDIVTETVNNFMVSTKAIENIQGGGIIGSLFALLFVKLFDINGTRIVTIALLVCGIVLFTGLSIIDSFKWASKELKKPFAFHKRKQKEKESQEEEELSPEVVEEDHKVVVSSMEELIHPKEEPIPEPEPLPLKETIEAIEPSEAGENKEYQLPPITLLKRPVKNNGKENQAALKDNITALVQVLHDFDIEGKVVEVHIGPAVTQYEVEIKAGTKVSKILNIHREIALALAAKDIRIEAPIPGKKTIGIEIPNKVNTMVSVREILEAEPPRYKDSKLLATLGRNILGQPIYCEINKTPHLLVAGSTGSGKSVCINSIIVSLLMRTKPDEVKLVLVDPKKVELSMYNGVPHLLAPVVTDPKRANIALKKIVTEMENRYDLFSETGTKNIGSYNEYIQKQNETLSADNQKRKMPYIVVIIDELADLMLVAAKEIEESIMRITQMARAAGIHLIVATQRPSTDVITGVIKSNIPSRIAFAVSSSIDSRTILDESGAERLLGKGDMLFSMQGENIPVRVQGTFLSDEEIKAVADYTISQQKAHYDNSLIMEEEEMRATTMVEDKDDYEEPLYNEIVEFVVTQGKASASLLQRRFRLGYNRAARAIDLLEERGIVGPSNGSKPREILVKVEKDK